MMKFVDIEFDGIDYNDYPDFVDAYISSAQVEETDGTLRPATEDELDSLNEDKGFVYEQLMDQFY